MLRHSAPHVVLQMLLPQQQAVAFKTTANATEEAREIQDAP
jgi:hypothetical protein